ncbi:MAG: helix-turn-helix transcriptional regulator [Lachnospiraceae bacterium]
MDHRERINFFHEMLSTCRNLQIWEYDKDLNLLTKPSPEDELMAYFFRFGNACSTLQTFLRPGQSRPYLLNNSASMLWIAVPSKDPEDPVRVRLLGPAFISEKGVAQARRIVRTGDQPLDIRHRLNDTFDRIPIVPIPDLFQSALMFAYAVNEEKWTISDIEHQNKDAGYDRMQEQPPEDLPDSLRHAGAWDVEQKLLEAVRTGNLCYREIRSEASAVSSGIKSRDPGSLRNMRDSLIMFLSLTSRAAIDGGLAPEISYSLCDFYTDAIENADTMAELLSVSNTMYDDFVRRVHCCRTDSTLSRPIRLACDYIELHFREPLSLGTLAELAGYTEYYFSHKFKKEVGKTPADYLTEKRIECAKQLLSGTSLPIQDISDSLQFGSRSYFSTVFQKLTGVSPSQYRSGARQEKQ